MPNTITLDVISARNLNPLDQTAIRDLCARAYEEEVWCDYGYLDQAFHVIGRDQGVIVSHALWVDRDLQVGQGELLRTAYVEYVATEPSRQGQGLASQLLRFLIQEIALTPVYQLAALAPAESEFYTRLGWVFWQGCLYIRHNGQLIATPDDDVMVYRLSNTPSFSVDDDLSAEWREGELW